MRVGFLFYSRIIADLGTLAFAAHQIILSTTSFGSNLVQGLSAGAASLTGRSLGAGDPGLAKRYNRSLAGFGLLVSGLIGVLFFGWGGHVARLFTSDQQVILLTGRVLKIAALITLPQSFLAIFSGALRGAGDTRWPLIAALTGMVTARIGLSFVFVLILNLGLEGAWLAALADQSIRALVIMKRYRTGKWQGMEV
jgi:Na+-driven multidrug efflux pump